MNIDFLTVDPLSWIGIGSACLAGSIIGFERQLLEKPVGIRTCVLICMGTYVFIRIAGAEASEGADPSRVIGQVVTGIGFLGAGVMMSRDGTIKGVTSAAAIWMLAAIGVTIGTGQSELGVKLALLTVFVLVGVDSLEGTFRRLREGVYARRDRDDQSDD
jgi:putative Mg2+ transporter-C (MgtC) family protein